jgi:hypothetical protein
LKKSETKNLSVFGLEISGVAGGVLERPCRAAALLFAGFVAIQSGSWLPSFTAPRQRPKMTRVFSFRLFSTISQGREMMEMVP